MLKQMHHIIFSKAAKEIGEGLTCPAGKEMNVCVYNPAAFVFLSERYKHIRKRPWCHLHQV